MSVPILFFFERHWDTIPKLLTKEMIPQLKDRGYGTFCVEAPEEESMSDLIAGTNMGFAQDTQLKQEVEKRLATLGIVKKLSEMSFDHLSDLMRLYVSSQAYQELAEKIKGLPAHSVFKQMLADLPKLGLSLKGVDISRSDYDLMTRGRCVDRYEQIKQQEHNRIQAFFKNIMKLRQQQEEGIVFACGASHAEGLIHEFKKNGLQDDILYYFPHSSEFYFHHVDDIQQIASNDVLKDHTHRLSEKDIPRFQARILHDLAKKTQYKAEVLDWNAHAKFLSEFFKTHVRVFMRPGCYLDAFINESEVPNIEELRQNFAQYQVETCSLTKEGRTFWVISGVNTSVVADKLRALASKKSC